LLAKLDIVVITSIHLYLSEVEHQHLVLSKFYNLAIH